MVATTQQNRVATDKPRVVIYLDPDIKSDLEKLARKQKRSLSNMINVLLHDSVAKARALGELKDE